MSEQGGKTAGETLPLRRFNTARVLVTGAASGIGRAVALQLAAEGATLVLADRNAEGLQQTANQIPNTTQLIYDAALPGASAEMAQQAAQEGLDAVMNIAGIYARARIEDLPLAEWSRVLTIDLTSVFEICQAALPALAASPRGAIVNTSSTAGLRGIAYAAHYAAAKAGVIGLTKALASELAPQGIRANVVAPGLIQTGIAQNLAPLKGPALPRITHPPRLPNQTEGADPKAIAAAYCYLAAPESQFVTGTVHIADGGAGLG